MSARPVILALDLGVQLGVAVGAAGGIPKSYSLRLKKSSEPGDVALAALLQYLGMRLGAHDISAVVKEAPISLGAFADLTNSEATVRLTYGYHAIVEAACALAGVPCSEVKVTKVRKHFLGRGIFEDRATAKAAVIKRCQLLGYLPADCFDTDRADALAVWDWAAAHVGKVPGALHLFGEEASA